MLDVDELPEKPNVNTFNSVLAGLIGGLAGLAVGHPFVKVRLQSRELSSRYKGTFNCFVSTIKQEKFIGLYKGMVGVGAINALVFGSYTYLMQLQAQSQGISYDETAQNAPLHHVFLAGMGSGVISSFVTCPMELAKVQLQNQTTNTTAVKGPLDCLHKMYLTGGLRYCFKGMVPTMLRELSFGPYFLTYEIVTRSLAKPNQELSGPRVVLAGGVAGIAAWCSTYFADVVKTRIQSEPHRYKGFIDCMKCSYYEEGWRIFFKGLTPTILRAFPSNAATFAAYTWTMNLFLSKETITRRTYEEAIL
ncbi:mitochondrial carrier [Rhizopus microsporus var. microsporus]|uniref:Mitochondrial carrier n=1 Tax=Rhizopus microsporus var. microsporus TaxID=86635 RepID=A0A1X0QVN1_RHIZD|nr:mitochondrial carrier [Rhizopus microsporus var. microsporus]